MRKNRTIVATFALLCPLSSLTAVEFLYDFEGDSGATVTDKLTTDGSQDGTIFNAVSFETTSVPFGSQAGRFDPPDVVEPTEPFSKIVIPESSVLGTQFTLAAHYRLDGAPGFTRLFTSFGGTGSVGDRLIIDFDPTGGVIPGMRAIVLNTVVGTPSVPEGLADPGYHHVAMTYDDGDVVLYLDGDQIAAGNVGSGPVEMGQDLRFGEDPHDLGGSANEQFRGNVDDILVIGRVLSAGEVNTIATSGVAGNVTPDPGELAIHYDFESPDSGTTITDRFNEVEENGFVIGNVQVDTDAANAAVGSQSGVLGDAPPTIPFSVIEVGPLGDLGSALTMAATINVPGGGHPSGGLTRLFSTFGGTGSVSGRLIFDFDPNASVEGIGMRVILPNGAAAVANETFSVDEDHHLAATYDGSNLRLYLDGTEVASTATSGSVDLGEFPLRIGEDIGGILNENFIGVMDDALFLGRALSAEEVATLASSGHAGLTAPPVGVDVFYDFEGDSTAATDKLDGDGEQNGTLFNGVEIVDSGAPFGAQAASFSLPGDVELFSKIEIPGTAELGTQFTLAAHYNTTDQDFTRLFTSYGGTGAVGARLLIDFDPSGSVIPGMRAIVQNAVVGTASVPAGLADPGYHHVAMTYDNGDVVLYFDGSQIAAGNVGGGAVSMGQNLRFGEDPHDLGGSADEQFRGNVDDILVIGSVLSAGEIATVAANGVSGNVTLEGDLAIHYDFEGGFGDAVLHGKVEIDADAANAAFGSQSAVLGDAPPPRPFSVIDLGALGNLGSSLTMAAVVNVPGGGQTNGGLTRLFSSFAGSGGVAGRLLFDFDPNATVENIGVRVILPNGAVAVASNTFSVNEPHHLALTYAEGELAVYLDGVEVATGSGSGDVDLGSFPLQVGEDLAGGVNEQLVGIVDEVLILSEPLTPEEIAFVADFGFFPDGAVVVLRGDCNSDGALDLGDLLCLVRAAFPGFFILDRSAPPEPCADPSGTLAVGDVNDDGMLNLTDILTLGNFLFGMAPPDTSVGCIGVGFETGCENSVACE